MRVLGRGASKAPRAGRAPGLGDGALRSAVLRLVGDGACARAYRTVRGNGGERFDGARMLCAGDPDGRPPLASACVGDSGGPLYGGSRRAPVLVGIVSFGGDRCGADRLPSVFTQVSRYRSFIAAPAPVWAPWASAPATISRSGSGGYSCVVPRWAVVPDRVDVTWERLRAGGPLRVATGQTYVPGPADRGHVLACSIVASNAGGVSTAPAGAVSSVRIEG